MSLWLSRPEHGAMKGTLMNRHQLVQCLLSTDTVDLDDPFRASASPETLSALSLTSLSPSNHTDDLGRRIDVHIAYALPGEHIPTSHPPVVFTPTQHQAFVAGEATLQPQTVILVPFDIPLRWEPPQARPIRAIHHPDPPVQTAHQHRPRVPRDVQTRHGPRHHIHRDLAHPDIVAPQPPIDAAGHDFVAVPGHDDAGNPVFRLVKHHQRLRVPTLNIPQPHGCIVAATDDHTIPIPRERHAVDPTRVSLARVAAEPSQRAVCAVRHVPQEHAAVAADTRERLIVLRNRDV